MPKNKRDKYVAAYEALTLGLVFPVAIALGYFGGRWLDGLLNTSPWLTGIGTLLGIAAAFVQLARTGRGGDGSGSGGAGTPGAGAGPT
jgi:F0F1-type ATP synthase assembly protein I